MNDPDTHRSKVKLRDGRAVGLNQSRKLIKSGQAERVFVASDADFRIREEIKELCGAFGIPLDSTKNMAALGSLCGIDVDCSVFAVSRIS